MAKDICILGIHDGHNCGASLLINGRIVASVSEERISRVKNEVGYPQRSIETVVKQAGKTFADIDSVALASNFMHDSGHLRDISPWYRVGIDDQKKDKLANKDYNKIIFDVRRKERVSCIEQHLGLSADKIEFVEHHTAHAAAAYFSSKAPFDEKVLVFTNDGAGDGISATVSICENGKMERVSSTDRSRSLGKLYSRITYLLGMKPWEHEYKLMGMAPYADEKYSTPSKDVFYKLLALSDDGLDFELQTELETSYCYYWLRDNLENHRFDSVAAGIQSFTEEMMVGWVKAHMKKTGIRKIACGGGCFMNVKANSFISDLDEVDYMYALPSCGDESLSIGAAYKIYQDVAPTPERHSLDTLYLGPEFNDEAVAAACEKFDLSGCTIEKCDDINERVGKELAVNKIIARFAGNMEWGARALGNRSILANASHYPNVERINAMIKQRDFWMPFAPSILEERSDDYFVNPKKLDTSFMMYALPTKKLAHEHLSAGIHPRDKTARAQTVNEKNNPGYYALIKSYEKETGRGGVLNTSFNLHGFPIVHTPEDAIDVFLRSGLECLAAGNYLLSKKEIDV